MERPEAYGDREFLTEEEVAERASLDAIRAQGASEEELDGVVRPWDLDRPTGYDKKIVGQEYNRFWTDSGPRRQRETWGRTSFVIDPPDGRIPPFTSEVLRRWETRVSEDRIEYQYTVDDPMTYVEPYSVLRPLGKEDDSYLLVAPACHEGNYGMANSLRAARSDEEWALAASEDERANRRPQVEAAWEELRQWEASQPR